MLSKLALLLLSVLVLAGAARGRSAPEFRTVHPAEDPQALLHNPDMGWVLYENYPLDPRPGGSSTLVNLPGETFPGVDAVALMFSWQDVEARPGQYDFSRVDHAYDYWRKRGKQIQLRVSTESLLWWNRASPPSGKGVPDYVLQQMSAEHKQVRTAEGIPYTVVDARDPYYRQRLRAFLCATAAHYTGSHAVTLVDLRGFGLWGEWHSGYRYATSLERHAALKSVIRAYSEAFPRNWLALSYSYDPDSPESYRSGPAERYDPVFTAQYPEFLRFSAFDYALTRPNVTFRRDGVGGAVHSNERRLNEEAFATRQKGPMMTEFLGGYAANAKAGGRHLRWMINDALSQHPNYMNLLGWQGGEALAFLREQPELFQQGLRNMGYRLVPTRITYPAAFQSGRPFRVEMEWENRGVGRAMRDYRLKLLLADADGRAIESSDTGALRTSRWIKGERYPVRLGARFVDVKPGRYTLRFVVVDPRDGTVIRLPLKDAAEDGSCPAGEIECGVPTP